LISKLRADSALYLRYLQQTTIEDGLETRIYQVEALHKEFAQALNVVIIVKTNLLPKHGRMSSSSVAI
jgi:hypothetical protein